MSWPPFIRSMNPADEAARPARKDPAAVSVAKCTSPACKGGSGEARGPIASALLIHKAEAHSAASGHVVAILVRPETAQ